MPAHRTLLVATLAATLERMTTAARAVDSAARFVEGIVLASLSDEELRELTTARYRAAPETSGAGMELFAWELPWLQRDLPPAPARVLLGGAGKGRELRWLRAQGYQVLAFDPAVDAHAAGVDVVVASYEELAQAPPAQGPASDAVQAIYDAAPFDAVLLGWGSFTHVPGDAARLELLRVLRRLCTGPVLMSYWRRAATAPAIGSRAATAGARLAGWVNGAPRQRRPGDRINPRLGFAHAFTRQEIETVAAAAGFAAACHYDGYPHATLTPVAAGLPGQKAPSAAPGR